MTGSPIMGLRNSKTQERRRDERRNKGQPEGNLQGHDQGKAQISPKHQKLALCKIDDGRGLIDQDKTQCDQGINASHHDAADQRL
jgi:hypothetical protein